jgi:hypothetical protein
MVWRAGRILDWHLGFRRRQSWQPISKWWPPPTDFSTILAPAILKARARDADRNNPWAHRAVNLLRDYVISTGVVPMADLADAALRERVHKLWTARLWCSDWRKYYCRRYICKPLCSRRLAEGAYSAAPSPDSA